MKKSLKKLIIIPAFNEGQNLHELIEEIKKEVPDYDYIIINDGSTDNTVDVCGENYLNAIHIPINLGIGGAVQTGYIYAMENGYDIAVQLDGDGQHDPKALPALVKKLEEDECDLVIGSRFLKGEGFQSSFMRRVGISILSFLIYILTGKRYYDVTSGLRACNSKIIEIFSKIYPEDFPETESLMMLQMLGCSIVEVPVVMRKRKSGSSSIGWFSAIYFMVKVTLSILVMRIRSVDNIFKRGII